jgi:hypothetical protein
MQSVHLNLNQGEVYNIMIKFVSDMRQVSGFLQVLRFPPPTKFHELIYPELSRFTIMSIVIQNINHVIACLYIKYGYFRVLMKIVINKGEGYGI